MENGYLIVGLGNPGGEYADTRHNAGFMVLDQLASRWGASWKMESGFKARIARAGGNAQRVWLCQPQTYMNLSGEAVRRVMDFYHLDPGRMLVVVDDADLPLGEIRMRPKGGNGGHRGLESIQGCMGTTEYPRLRVGIGRRLEAGRELAGFVLAKFAKTEQELLEKVIKRAADQAECWAAAGINEAMNKFNGTVDGSEVKKESE